MQEKYVGCNKVKSEMLTVNDGMEMEGMGSKVKTQNEWLKVLKAKDKVLKEIWKNILKEKVERFHTK